MAKAAYVGIDEVARKIKKFYIGIPTDIPIYGTVTGTTNINFTYTDRAHFFSDNASTASTGWKMSSYSSSGGVKLVPNNFGIDSSTATITLTALKNLTNVTVKGIYYTESNYDKITLVVANSTKLNAVSGTVSSLTTFYTGNLSTGQTIKFTYTKDGSRSDTNESSTYFVVDCNDVTITTEIEEIVGYETKEVARKVKNGYIGVDGVAKQFFPSEITVTYSGTCTISDVTVDNLPYKLWTITGSGTLEVSDPVEYWMCGGGGKGGTAVAPTGTICTSIGVGKWKDGYTAPGASGGGGGGGYISTGYLEAGSHVVTIGAGNSGATSIGTLTTNGGSAGAAPNGGAGGSGGGSGVSWKPGSGSQFTATAGSPTVVSSRGSGKGISGYPFGLTTSMSCHCAGGGGGGDAFTYVDTGDGVFLSEATGGKGGTNGGYGGNSTEYDNPTSFSPIPTSSGGNYGGGAGGGADFYANSTTNGAKATFYGSGGGGGGRSCEKDGTTTRKSGGAGYQGVAYLLIPA